MRSCLDKRDESVSIRPRCLSFLSDPLLVSSAFYQFGLCFVREGEEFNLLEGEVWILFGLLKMVSQVNLHLMTKPTVKDDCVMNVSDYTPSGLGAKEVTKAVHNLRFGLLIKPCYYL